MRTIVLIVAASFHSGVAFSQDTAETIVRSLENFGPIGTPAEARQTWQLALTAMQENPGVIVVPGDVWPLLNARSLQTLPRIPDPPAETKTWRRDAGP